VPPRVQAGFSGAVTLSEAKGLAYTKSTFDKALPFLYNPRQTGVVDSYFFALSAGYVNTGADHGKGIDEPVE
jgi:hypothetical protein